jgi:hypothetical protein
MQKRHISILLAGTAVAAFIGYQVRAHIARTAGQLPELIGLVPANSSLVAYVDIAELRKAPSIEDLAAIAAPIPLDPDYVKFVNATGFDYRRDLDQLMIAAIGDGRFAIADGRFDQDKIDAYALRSGAIEHGSNRTVYKIKGSQPGHDLSLTFLSKHRIAIATGGELTDYLQLSRQPLAESVQQRVLRVAGSPAFVDWQIPESGERHRASAGPFGIAALESLRSIDLAVRPEGEQILISVEGECTTAVQAQNLSATLEVLRTALPAELMGPAARGHISPDTATLAARLIQNAVISNDEDRVRLLVAIAADTITDSLDKK